MKNFYIYSLSKIITLIRAPLFFIENFSVSFFTKTRKLFIFGASFFLFYFSSTEPFCYAFHSSRTLPGIVEQAALLSELNRWVIENYHPDGLHAEATLNHHDVIPGIKPFLPYFKKISKAESYAPLYRENEDAHSQSLLGWLSLGAALSGITLQQLRHQFYSPDTDWGLSPVDSAWQEQIKSFRSGLSDISQFFTGTAFKREGLSSLHWVQSKYNPLGLFYFQELIKKFSTHKNKEQRENALVQAFLCAGSILAVLSQLADPAHVHNDFEAALPNQPSSFATFVENKYGRNLQDFSRNSSQSILNFINTTDVIELSAYMAKYTHDHFFSPALFTDTKSSSTKGPLSLILPIHLTKERGYVFSNKSKPILAWIKKPNEPIHYFLDERCYTTYAEELLPLAIQFAKTSLNLLFFRPFSIKNPPRTPNYNFIFAFPNSQIAPGTITLFGESSNGERALITTKKILELNEQGQEAVFSYQIPNGIEPVKWIVVYETAPTEQHPHPQIFINSLSLTMMK